MIIRATRKVLSVNRINPVKNDHPLIDQLPGEWYVDLISLGKPGQFGLHFLHHPTKLVIIVKGKSLRKCQNEFSIRLEKYLQRNNYGKLTEKFDLNLPFEIYPTNDRGMLAVMNQIKWNSEYHCIKTGNPDLINFDWIEDISLDNLFTMKKTGQKYWHTKKILDQFLINYSD